MKLLLRSSILLVVLLAVSACCIPRVDQRLTPFPPAPSLKELDRPPVVSFDNRDNTYVITQEYLNNAVLTGLFVDEVLLWKRENNIR